MTAIGEMVRFAILMAYYEARTRRLDECAAIVVDYEELRAKWGMTGKGLDQ